MHGLYTLEIGCLNHYNYAIESANCVWLPHKVTQVDLLAILQFCTFCWYKCVLNVDLDTLQEGG